MKDYILVLKHEVIHQNKLMNNHLNNIHKKEHKETRSLRGIPVKNPSDLANDELLIAKEYTNKANNNLQSTPHNTIFSYDDSNAFITDAINNSDNNIEYSNL